MLPLKEKDAFHARYGCTITQYIQGQRMERAERLLANTDLPVGQIAQIVGYQNPSRFAEIFRRNTGRSPAEYRRAYCNYFTEKTDMERKDSL